MATQAELHSNPNTAPSDSEKRSWWNPRWLLLPLAAVLGTSAFLIVRRRKSSAAS